MSDALPVYSRDLPHESHPLFHTFRDIMSNQMVILITEYISLWQSCAVEMSRWDEYRRSTPEKKAGMFWTWFSRQQPAPAPVSVPTVMVFPPFPSSSQPPKPKKGMGKGEKGKGKGEKGKGKGKGEKKGHGSAEQHQRCYAFMQSCLDRLQKGNVTNRNGVKEAFDIAAKQCPESIEKTVLVSAFDALTL